MVDLYINDDCSFKATAVRLTLAGTSGFLAAAGTMNGVRKLVAAEEAKKDITSISKPTREPYTAYATCGVTSGLLTAACVYTVLKRKLKF
mgnify:FL=1